MCEEKGTSEIDERGMNIERARDQGEQMRELTKEMGLIIVFIAKGRTDPKLKRT